MKFRKSVPEEEQEKTLVRYPKAPDGCWWELQRMKRYEDRFWVCLQTRKQLPFGVSFPVTVGYRACSWWNAENCDGIYSAAQTILYEYEQKNGVERLLRGEIR